MLSRGKGTTLTNQSPTDHETSKPLVPWFKKKAIVIPLGILLLIILSNIARGSGTPKADPAPSENTMVTEDPTYEPEPVVTEEPDPVVTEDPEPVGPVETMSQSNAVSTAEDYIQYSSFSRSGLIDQLKYEGFSTADSTYAVDNITVDWNEQAAQTAQEYLDTSSFSRDGLYDQLIYEGFSSSQANYGLDAVGY
jgi:hypothetical protein